MLFSCPRQGLTPGLALEKKFRLSLTLYVRKFSKDGSTPNLHDEFNAPSLKQMILNLGHLIKE
jgi:hypothetical protein